MKSLLLCTLTLVVASLGLCPAQTPHKRAGDRERLIGAWHLAHIHSPGQNAAETNMPEPSGMLIYTSDGHVSVQLMYPAPQRDLNNQYVRNGYEASFGSYEINEATHTLIHHIQGANTEGLLVGKSLTRIYHFTEDGHLIIRPANPDEHWSVEWERY